MEKYGGGSLPAGAHGGGWECLGKDEREPVLSKIYTFKIRCHGNGDAFPFPFLLTGISLSGSLNPEPRS